MLLCCNLLQRNLYCYCINDILRFKVSDGCGDCGPGYVLPRCGNTKAKQVALYAAGLNTTSSMTLVRYALIITILFCYL